MFCLVQSYIAMYANNAILCFWQLKHHLNVMDTFLFVIDELLFLHCGITFGSSISPASWEPIQNIAEQLTMALFNDNSLQEKHKHHLDKLKWDVSLQNYKKQTFTPALGDSCHSRVLHPDISITQTPHHLFIDDNMETSMTNTTFNKPL